VRALRALAFPLPSPPACPHLPPPLPRWKRN
jgi:hypothetical protein